MGFDRLTACSWCGAKWVKLQRPQGRRSTCFIRLGSTKELHQLKTDNTIPTHQSCVQWLLPVLVVQRLQLLVGHKLQCTMGNTQHPRHKALQNHNTSSCTAEQLPAFNHNKFPPKQNRHGFYLPSTMLTFLNYHDHEIVILIVLDSKQTTITLR